MHTQQLTNSLLPCSASVVRIKVGERRRLQLQLLDLRLQRRCTSSSESHMRSPLTTLKWQLKKQHLRLPGLVFAGLNHAGAAGEDRMRTHQNAGKAHLPFRYTCPAECGSKRAACQNRQLFCSFCEHGGFDSRSGRASQWNRT